MEGIYDLEQVQPSNIAMVLPVPGPVAGARLAGT